MSNQLDDFLISLGFDTSKIKSQVAGLEKALNKVAVETGKTQTKQVKKDMNGHVVLFQKAEHKRQKAAEKASKQITKQKISDEQLVQRAIEARQAKELKREEELYKIAKKKADLSDASARQAAKSYSFIESARRQQNVRALLNPEKNPQLKAMGNQYRQMQSNLIGTKRLEARRRNIVDSIKNLGIYRQFKGTTPEEIKRNRGSEERKLLAKILLEARAAAKRDKFKEVRQIRANLGEYGRVYRENKRGGNPAFNTAAYAQTQSHNAFQTGQISKKFQDALLVQLKQAKTKTDVDRTIGTVGRISRMRGASADQVANAQNVEQLKRYGEQLKRNNAELNAAARRSFGLAAAQGSLRDSTRNLVREYASLYAIFAGTNAIKEQVKGMDGARAGLAAVSKDANEAAYNMSFVKEVALKNGLAIADTAKDYVKLKAAIGDMHTMKETEDMFISLTKAGVVFQLSQDDMKGVLRATQQIFSKQKITAEELEVTRLPM